MDYNENENENVNENGNFNDNVDYLCAELDSSYNIEQYTESNSSIKKISFPVPFF